jgi:hypothetical protein
VGEEEGIGFGGYELMRIESKYKLANSSLTNISTLKPQNLTKPIKTSQLLLLLSSMYILWKRKKISSIDKHPLSL